MKKLMVLVVIAGLYAGLVAANGSSNTGNWGSIWGTEPGVDGHVWVMIADNAGNLYVGGEFTSAGGVPAKNIAKWNGSNWSALDTGVDGEGGVYALALIDNVLYAGGYFNTAGGLPASGIAQWDGSTWSTLGAGTKYNDSVGAVYALTVIGSDLYVGGEFKTAGNISVNNIAKWDGSIWSTLGDGVDGGVFALQVMDSDLYVGGWFYNAGGQPVSSIAKWDGGTWSTLGDGIQEGYGYAGTVHALAAIDNNLYVGGWFDSAGGQSANSIAKWDGTAWSTLGSGIQYESEDIGTVYALAVAGTNLYVGGWFTVAGGSLASRVAKWDGSTWSTLGIGVDSGVFALAAVGNDLYVGGQFYKAGGEVAYSIAKWQSRASGSFFIEPPDNDSGVETIGTYECFLYAGEDEGGGVSVMPALIHGTLSVKVSNTKGKLSAKAILQGSTISFSAKEWEDAADGVSKYVSVITRKGEELELFIRQNRIWGSISGGSINDKLQVVGARNRFADKKDLEAQNLLENYKGYYTATLCWNCFMDPGDLEYSGSLDPAPRGEGYMATTISNSGKVKVAGVLADGTKVSRAGVLLWFPDSSNNGFLPLLVPLYVKKGVFSGLMEFDEEYLSTTGLCFWMKPGKDWEIDGFSQAIKAFGGLYQQPPTLYPEYLVGFALSEIPGYYVKNLGSFAVTYTPYVLNVVTERNKLVVPKGKAPKKQGNKADGYWYEYDDELNPAQVTFSFTPKTGIFKGKFKLYYDYDNAKGVLQHKAVSVPYAGIALQEDGNLVGGYGHCLIPDNDPEIKKYNIKRSMPVVFWDNNDGGT